MKYLYFNENKLFLVSSVKQDNALVEIIVDDDFDTNKEVESEFGLIKVDKTLEEIQADVTYSTARTVAYSQLNQFAMQFDDAKNGTTTWIDAINEIKAKYPKPTPQKG